MSERIKREMFILETHNSISISESLFKTLLLYSPRMPTKWKQFPYAVTRTETFSTLMNDDRFLQDLQMRSDLFLRVKFQV